ncbi:MAG: helix-turn-helix domain-containing protein [Butyricicoccus sp.]
MNNELVSRGNHLRNCRQEKKLTLRQLSEMTGISVGFLSKIEKGIGNPSISNIQKICCALDITVNELMTPKAEAELFSTIHKNASYVLRNTERCLLYNFSDVVRFEAIYEGNPHFKVNVMTLSAKMQVSGDAANRFSSTHSYDEFGIVAKGSMVLEIAGQGRYDLNEGDCIMIRAQTEHTVISSSEECISYWIEIAE